MRGPYEPGVPPPRRGHGSDMPTDESKPDAPTPVDTPPAQPADAHDDDTPQAWTPLAVPGKPDGEVDTRPEAGTRP